MNTAPWMVVGDFNDPPETSSPSLFFASQGAKLLGDGKEPTRWDGTRCIDWAMACAPTECFPEYQGLERQIHISDHIGIRFLLNVDARYPWRGRLGTAPIWKKPEMIEPDKWIEALELSWSHVGRSSEGMQLQESQVLPPTIHNMQKGWDSFMSCLNKCYYDAYAATLEKCQNENDVAELKKVMEKPGQRYKGGTTKHQWVTDCTKANDPSPGQTGRSLRRRLARAFEIRRFCLLDKMPDPHLIKKVFPQIDGDICIWDLKNRAQDLIEELKTMQKQEETERSNRCILEWKRRMNTGHFGDLSRWLKSKETPTKHVRVQDDQGIADHPRDITQKIYEYWEKMQNEPVKDPLDIASELSCWFGQVDNLEFTPFRNSVENGPKR